MMSHRNIWVLLLGLFVLAGFGFSATIYVNDSGSSCTFNSTNYTTIQAAINAASVGDIIQICANGSYPYTEDLIVNVSVNLVGNGTWVNSTRSTSNAMNVTAHYVNITGMNVSGANTTDFVGIHISGENATLDRVNVSAYNGVYITATANHTIIRDGRFLNSVENGLVVAASADSAYVFNNTMFANSNNSVYSSGQNCIFENNTIVNGSTRGFTIESSARNNTVYNNTITHGTYGIVAQNSNGRASNYSSNDFTNMTYGIYFNSGGANATVESNLFVNDTYGAYFTGNGASDVTVSSNTFANSSYGVYVNGASSSPSGLKITSNVLTNFTSSAVYFTGVGARNHVYSNSRIHLSVYGVYLASSSLINVTSNPIYNNSYGFYLTDANSSNVSRNEVSNCSTMGVYVAAGTGNTVQYNSVLDAREGLYLTASANNYILSNNITNSSVAGMTFAAVSTTTSLSGNRIVNASRGMNISGSNVNFSGANFVTSTPYNGFEVYIVGYGNLSTNSYNVTTDYGDYGFGRTTDVAIKAVNLSLVNTTIQSTLNGLGDAGSRVLPYLSNYFGLNVTNKTPNAALSPKMFFDASAKTKNNLALGRYNESAWYGHQPASWGSDYIVYEAYLGPYAGRNYSYFMPVAYDANLSSTPSSSDTAVSKTTPSLGKSFDCNTGALEVSTGVSGLALKLYNTKDYSYVSKTTDSNGKAVFTVSASGNYEVDSESTSSYHAAILGPFALAMCVEAPASSTPAATTTTPATTVPAAETETTEVVTTPATEAVPEVAEQPSADEVTKLDVLAVLSTSDSLIVVAVQEGKDVTEARAKLDAANAALASGNYAQAKALAEEVAELVKNAKAKAVATTPAATTTSKPTTTPTAQKGLDMGMVLIGVVVLVVIVGLAYYFTQKGGKGYKGHRRV